MSPFLNPRFQCFVHGNKTALGVFTDHGKYNPSQHAGEAFAMTEQSGAVGLLFEDEMMLAIKEAGQAKLTNPTQFAIFLGGQNLGLEVPSVHCLWIEW